MDLDRSPSLLTEPFSFLFFDVAAFFASTPFPRFECDAMGASCCGIGSHIDTSRALGELASSRDGEPSPRDESEAMEGLEELTEG